LTSYNDRKEGGDRSLKGEIVVLLSEGEGERKEGRDFPGGPVAKALCSQCRQILYHPSHRDDQR